MAGRRVVQRLVDILPRHYLAGDLWYLQEVNYSKYFHAVALYQSSKQERPTESTVRLIIGSIYCHIHHVHVKRIGNNPQDGLRQRESVSIHTPRSDSDRYKCINGETETGIRHLFLGNIPLLPVEHSLVTNLNSKWNNSIVRGHEPSLVTSPKTVVDASAIVRIAVIDIHEGSVCVCIGYSEVSFITAKHTLAAGYLLTHLPSFTLPMFSLVSTPPLVCVPVQPGFGQSLKWKMQ